MFTKSILAQKEITRHEAESLITDARCFDDEIVAYQNIKGMLYRTFAIPRYKQQQDEHWGGDLCEEDLLEYARRNMPENLHFG